MDMNSTRTNIVRFVAIGDSFTKGVGDAAGLEPKGAHDHLADRLRQLTPELVYFNLAEQGLTAEEVWTRQASRAAALEPDLISIIAGANDAVQGPWNARRYETTMREMFAAFATKGVLILTATLVNFPVRFQVPEAAGRRMERNLREANEVIRRVADAAGAVCVDLWDHPVTKPEGHWSGDLIHPNALGYAETGKVLWQGLQTRLERGGTT